MSTGDTLEGDENMNCTPHAWTYIEWRREYVCAKCQARVGEKVMHTPIGLRDKAGPQ
jgi:hypothetical protein